MTAGTVDLEATLARVSSEIADAALVDAVTVLGARASPPGAERDLARDVASWGRTMYPGADWATDDLDARSANLVARSVLVYPGAPVRELAIYSHLDTSLTGLAELDAPITGEPGPPPALSIDLAGRTLRGFGVGVAKAPSAAAIVAFARAAASLRALAVPHRLTLFLAAGGTHRAAPAATAAAFGRGVRHALASGWRPDAVLNVKGGPPGVLYEEPGAAYLRVRLRRRWSAALARRDLAPDGGLVRHAGTVLDAIERWRDGYLAAHRSDHQVAPELAIGAIRSGSPDKPDLLPGLLEIFVYAVLPSREDSARVARELGAFLAPVVAALPGGASVEVEVYACAPGGSADPASEIVRLAASARAQHVGPASPIREWSGATDGAIFLAEGILTARMGPLVSRDERDPRVESVSLDELLACTRAYVDVAVRYFATPASS